jgi:opacity protein-like surface antigen
MLPFFPSIMYNARLTGEAEEPMLRIVSCVFIAMATLCVSNFAYAQEDYSRAGCYLGLGAAAALPLSADDTLDDETERVFGPVRFFRPYPSADIDESFGLHARAGCRNTWGGGELHFEWSEGYDIKVADRNFKVDGWALTADAKLYLVELVNEALRYFEAPAGPEHTRFQPFATAGIGYLTWDLSKLRDNFTEGARTKIPEPVFPHNGFKDWDFALRLGGGLDVYLTRNIAISLDATYVLPTSSDLNDMDYLSLGVGLLYRY